MARRARCRGAPTRCAVSPDYRLTNLLADTEALLTPATPVIVRLETLRRAVLYASRDRAVAEQVLARFQARARWETNGPHPDPRALLDAAFVTDLFRQLGERRPSRIALDVETIGSKIHGAPTNQPRTEGTSMTIGQWHIGAALALTMIASHPIGSKAQVNETLSDKDKEEIQSMVAKYAPALIGCHPEAWADLFATPGGYFASGPRGELRERKALMEMALSYDRCYTTPGVTPAAAAANGTGGGAATARPPSVIEFSPEGAKAKTRYGKGPGYYDDIYVKTPKGWKFKARQVISDEEIAAHLTAQDFIEIRQLGGDDHGHYEDLYGDHEHPTPGGPPAGKEQGRPFRTSGLRLLVSPEGVRGLAYLRDNGGHYEDLYVKTPAGWRIKERKYLP